MFGWDHDCISNDDCAGDAFTSLMKGGRVSIELAFTFGLRAHSERFFWFFWDDLGGHMGRLAASALGMAGLKCTIRMQVCFPATAARTAQPLFWCPLMAYWRSRRWWVQVATPGSCGESPTTNGFHLATNSTKIL